MYFRRIKIENFGPIRSLELKDLERGRAYHFIAQNDTGKSNLIEALDIVCHNVPDIHVQKYVSDYADYFLIEVEDFEGNIITLRRGQGLSEYTLQKGDDIKTWNKQRGSVPLEIQRLFNMYTNNEKINFRYQDDRILFMNTTPGENYAMFQKALRTDVVLEALKKARQKERIMLDEMNDITSKVNYLSNQKQSYPDISLYRDEILLYKKSTEDIYSNYKLEQSLINYLNRLEHIDNLLMYAYELQEKVKEIEQYIKVIKVIDYLEELENKNDLILELLEIDFNVDIRKWKEIIDYCERVYFGKDKEKYLIDINILVKEILAAMEENKRLHAIYKYINNVDVLDEQRNMLEKIISNVDVVYKYLEIEKNLFNLDENINNFKVAREALMTLDEQTQHLNNEYDNLIKENNICPVVIKRKDRKCPLLGVVLDSRVGGLSNV